MRTTLSQNGSLKKKTPYKQLLNKMFASRYLYLMLLPCMLNFIIFHYLPMYGLQIAFKRFNIVLGAAASPWYGFKHFENFFNSYYFTEILGNTLRISAVSIIIGFPFPILFALMLNEVRNQRMKKLIQTISYLPYFVAVVVMVGMASLFLEQDGLINVIHKAITGRTVYFMGEPKYFMSIYQIMGLWRWTGFDAILYLAAISSVDQELYSAAAVDGAGRIRRIWHITLPGIRSTIIVLFIMRLGNILNVSWQEILLLQNSLTEGVSEVIQTFVYKRGVMKADYGFATAVGLFQSVIGFILVITANKVGKRYSDTYIF